MRVRKPNRVLRVFEFLGGRQIWRYLLLPQADVKATMTICACSYQVWFADKRLLMPKMSCWTIGVFCKQLLDKMAWAQKDMGGQPRPQATPVELGGELSARLSAEADCSKLHLDLQFPKLLKRLGELEPLYRIKLHQVLKPLCLQSLAHCSFLWLTASSKKPIKMGFTSSISISQVILLICVFPCSLGQHLLELWSPTWMSVSVMGTLTLCPTPGRQLCTPTYPLMTWAHSLQQTWCSIVRQKLSTLLKSYGSHTHLLENPMHMGFKPHATKPSSGNPGCYYQDHCKDSSTQDFWWLPLFKKNTLGWSVTWRISA